MALVRIPYAQALFEAAKERGTLDKVVKAMDLIVKAIYSNKELLAVLNHPRITAEKKKELLKMTIGDLETPLTSRFLGVLIDNKRSDYLRVIHIEFKKLAFEHMGCMKVIVTTAVPLDDEKKKRLVEAIEKDSGKKIILNEKVDKEIIGGMVIEYQGRRKDGSIRGKLEDVRNNLVGMTL
ncbi:MAG: ATP synthase F1 subunit delta [Tissierellia bacterium]|nr:ATP synthase F1 subunit delta [Tissierellia bacterium]